jgi:ERCC4-type nuclease
VILIDRRIGSAELLKPIESLGVKVSLETLDAGDMAFEGNGARGTCLVGIERKCIGDMMTSIESKRLTDKQIPAMTQLYDHNYIVVEGMFKQGAGGTLEIYKWGKWMELKAGPRKFTYPQMLKYVNTMMLMAGFHYLRTSTPDETALTVVSLYHWFQKDWSKHKGLTGFHAGADHVTITAPGLLRRVAAELPGIGWERSAEVSKKFGTLWAMSIADEEQWTSIPGIGKKIAANVVKAIRSTSR